MPAQRPTVYLDSNILSVLAYRGGHMESQVQHVKTRDWWEKERRHFSLLTSRWTEGELERGVYPAQKGALALVRRINYLARTADVDTCMKTYIEKGLVPANKFGDAIQLAFCTAYRLDYLLSWNHAHLVNADVQHRLEELHRKMKWRTPWLVSPDTIPWTTLGQEIRRKND